MAHKDSRVNGGGGSWSLGLEGSSGFVSKYLASLTRQPEQKNESPPESATNIGISRSNSRDPRDFAKDMAGGLEGSGNAMLRGRAFLEGGGGGSKALLDQGAVSKYYASLISDPAPPTAGSTSTSAVAALSDSHPSSSKQEPHAHPAAPAASAPSPNPAHYPFPSPSIMASHTPTNRPAVRFGTPQAAPSLLPNKPQSSGPDCEATAAADAAAWMQGGGVGSRAGGGADAGGSVGAHGRNSGPAASSAGEGVSGGRGAAERAAGGDGKEDRTVAAPKAARNRRNSPAKGAATANSAAASAAPGVTAAAASAAPPSPSVLSARSGAHVAAAGAASIHGQQELEELEVRGMG